MPMVYSTPEKYETYALVTLGANFHGVPEELAHGVAATESNYRCDKVGKAGELGPLQVKPATAFWMGLGDPNRLKDCVVGVYYGLLYLRKALDACGGNRTCAISRYNRGLRGNPTPPKAYNNKVQKNLSKWTKAQ